LQPLKRRLGWQVRHHSIQYDERARKAARFVIFRKTPDMAKTLPTTASYYPDNLLDAIIAKLKLKNDAALSRALKVAPPVISKIRHRTLPIGATILLRMHDVSDFSIRELRALMASPKKFNTSSAA
jgi:hypothetical protein